jgi:hypothetical protein
VIALSYFAAETEEDHLDHPGVPVEPESLLIVHDHERLRPARIAGIPNRVMNADPAAQKTRPGPRQSHYIRGNIDHFVVCYQVAAGREVQPAQTVEDEGRGDRKNSLFTGRAQAAWGTEHGYFSECQVYAVGLELPADVAEVLHQWRYCLQSLQDIFSGKDTKHLVTNGSGQ